MGPTVFLLAVRSAVISPRRISEVRAPFPARRYNRRVDVRQWCRADQRHFCHSRREKYRPLRTSGHNDAQKT